MNSRLMKYEEVKGVRFVLTKDKPEAEVVFDEKYEAVRIEDLQGSNNVAVYINDCAEDDYILLRDTLVFEDISVKKIKVKIVNKIGIPYHIQATVMR